MRAMYRFLLYFIFLNSSFTIVNELMLLCGVPVWYNPQVSPEELQSGFNPENVVSGWNSWVGTILYVGDVVGGLLGMFNHVINVFAGFPVFLIQLGIVPGVIIDVLCGVNAVVWCLAIWQWISGRRMDQ